MQIGTNWRGNTQNRPNCDEKWQEKIITFYLQNLLIIYLKPQKTLHYKRKTVNNFINLIYGCFQMEFFKQGKTLFGTCLRITIIYKNYTC